MIATVTFHQAGKYAVDMHVLQDTTKTFLLKNFGCARKVYDLYVAWLYDTLEKAGYTGGDDIPAVRLPEVTQFKKQFPYMKESDSLVLANAKQDFEHALKGYREDADHKTYTRRALRRDASGTEPLSFRGLKGMPKFHAKAMGHFSYRTSRQKAGGSLWHTFWRILRKKLLLINAWLPSRPHVRIKKYGQKSA